MPAELREILEEQLNADSTAESSTASVAPPPETLPVAAPADSTASTAPAEAASDTKPAVETAPVQQETATEEPSPKGTTSRIDRAPQSWKNEVKATWGQLPLQARQEIIRREQQVNQVLQESSQYKNVVQELERVSQPFQARMNQLGANPVTALGNLLQADNYLATAPAPQRAQYMAKLIKDYGIDVALLDEALSGQYTPEAKQQTHMQELLEQQLQPYKQFMQQTLQQQQAQQRAQQQKTNDEIASMSEDPAFPHFNEVRADMADIMEMSAKRGVYVTLQQAYQRAVALNPNLVQIEQQRSASNDIHARAQQAAQQATRAASAAVSVAGAPASATHQANPNDLRALLESSYEDSSGRL